MVAGTAECTHKELRYLYTKYIKGRKEQDEKEKKNKRIPFCKETTSYTATTLLWMAFLCCVAFNFTSSSSSSFVYFCIHIRGQSDSQIIGIHGNTKKKEKWVEVNLSPWIIFRFFNINKSSHLLFFLLYYNLRVYFYPLKRPFMIAYSRNKKKLCKKRKRNKCVRNHV